MVRDLLARHSFSHSITTSEETTSRYLFQRGKLCGNNHNSRSSTED